MDEADEAGTVTSLPATMADIFLALVAVVIMMLLALAPAIRTSGALAAQPPIDLLRSEITIEGRPATVIEAEADGIRTGGQDSRLVPLAAILDDADLRRQLSDADPASILLMIRPDGQEAAFLFDALASGLGIRSMHRLRTDAGCGHVADPRLGGACRPETGAERT